MTGLVNGIYSNNNETNNNNKKQLTASFFENRKLKGKGKIHNIMGAYGEKRNEEIKKGLDNRKN